MNRTGPDFFVVGPPVDDVDKLRAAEEAWRRYDRDVANRPLAGWQEPEFTKVYQECFGNACAFLKGDDPETAMIVLADRFFQRTSTEQTATLLHECIHLHYMSGVLRPRRKRAEAFDLEWENKPYLNECAYMAIMLWQIPEEALVEQYTIQQHRDIAVQRMPSWLRHINETNWADGVARQPAAVRQYAALYSWLQLEVFDMAARLLEVQAAETLVGTRESLENLCSEYWTRDWPQTKAMARKLIEVDVVSGKTDDETAAWFRDRAIAAGAA